MAEKKIKFQQGIPEGAELIMKDLFLNYRDSFNGTMNNYEMTLDFDRAGGEVLEKICGGVMVQHMSYVKLGRIGKYPAVQFVKPNGMCHEHILSHLSMEESAEYELSTGRIDHDMSIDPLRGDEFRRQLRDCVKHSLWREYKVGDVVIGIEKGLTQVNNMADMAEQLRYDDDNHGKSDRWKQHLCKIEGITDMTDKELEEYDYFNTKPEGHEGGGWTFSDDDSGVEFGYRQSRETKCFESMTSVWMFRGETKCLFADCEGGFYCEYIIMPIGWREMWKDILN